MLAFVCVLSTKEVDFPTGFVSIETSHFIFLGDSAWIGANTVSQTIVSVLRWLGFNDGNLVYYLATSVIAIGI